MFLARVIGSVWSSVKWPEVEGLKLLLVRPYSYEEVQGRGGGVLSLGPGRPEEGGGGGEGLPACTDLVVVADVLGAGVGEDVVIAYGHAGRMAIEPDLAPGALATRPVDAAVVAIVDSLDMAGMEGA